MSKKLTPLEALNELRNNYVPVFRSRRMGKQQVVKSFAIIEKELKELEEYKKCIDLKETQFISTHNMSVVDTETFNQLVKNSQALEIIKEYKLITYQECFDAICTRGYVHDLPKDKVELLKEVLS